MFRSIANKFLTAALSELFTNISSSLQLNLSADLFADTSIKLQNLFFKNDIFDISLSPLRLVSGSVETLFIEGIAELALGGKLKFQMENIYLLFVVDQDIDAERMQYLKKLQIELLSTKVIGSIFRELLKRIQGLPNDKEPDLNKKRKVMFKAMDYIFKGIYGTFKSIHIRIEFLPSAPSPLSNANNKLISAVGIIIPQSRYAPNIGSRPDGISKNDPFVHILSKNVQIYIDYDRTSYTSTGLSDAAIMKQFQDRWKSELHTAFILPFNLEIAVAIELRRRIGLISPKILIKIPSLRFGCDARQMVALSDLLRLVTLTKKRNEQLIRIQKIFRKGFPIPRMYEIDGIRFLPHMVIKGKLYPKETTIPRSSQIKNPGNLFQSKPPSIVAFMKERVGNRWTVMLWKHLIRLVLNDLKLVKPFGRWRELANLAFIRRDY
eukprot:gene14405-19336_t